jgi:hypothetical protein
MQSSVLVFVLAVMVLGMLFFSFAATTATHQAWPFGAVACAAAIGLGLAEGRTRA